MVKDNKYQRTAFFISDRTGLTAEALGNSLLTQFDGIDFKKVHLPFIDTKDKALLAVKLVNKAFIDDGLPALIFSTQITDEYRDIVANSGCVFFDFFATFIKKMEDTLQIKSSHTAGKSHGLSNNKNYSNRMNSITFTLNSDDGVAVNSYNEADIILTGVSRSGKTPTCLFMALQYGIKAANYPLIEQDLQNNKLPEELQPHKHKLFGLTINPIRLQKIRDERMSNTGYASIKQCQKEVRRAEEIYHTHKIPFIDTTQMSIEEITTKIINDLSLLNR